MKTKALISGHPGFHVVVGGLLNDKYAGFINMKKIIMALVLILLWFSFSEAATLDIIPNGTDSNPNSPLHMLSGATKRVYANQCTGLQSLGCTSTTPTIYWSATCGTFSSSSGPFVDYTAPASGNSCVITATDASDSLTATATVTIENPPVTVNVLPHAITLYKGQHQLLQAFVVGSSNRVVTWSTTGGTLTSQGWTADFMADTPGTYTVTATSQADNTKTFSATLFVTNNTMAANATANHTEPVDCTATGSGRTYEVGPSQTYTTINAVPWGSLGAGDTVRIHNEGGIGNPTTYHERWLITTSGSVTEPLRICGVPNSNGELPVLDGAESTTLSSYNYHTMDGLGVIIIYAGYGTPWDGPTYAKYITIEGLKIIHAQSNPVQQYYNQTAGVLTNFSRGTAGIRVQSGANIIIRGNDLENDDNGVFTNCQIPETLMSRWHLIQGNYFSNNGTINNTHDHSTYAQAFGQVIQGNYYDDKVTGDQGSQIKTRSAANIIRYNYIQAISNKSLGRLLDIVAPEASNAEATVQEYLANVSSFSIQTVAGVTAMEDWYNAYVYGNIFNDATVSVPIHYAEDNCAEDVTGLPGYFYHNTFYAQGVGGSGRWYFIDSDYGSGGASGCFVAKPRTRFPQAVLANNAIKIPNTSITSPYFFWTRDFETSLYLYTNWISSAWGNGGVGGVFGNGTAYQITYPAVSYITGNSAQHVYVGNTGATCNDNTCGGELILSSTPSQMPFDGTTFAPVSGSPLIGAATSLPHSLASDLPVTYQYNPSTYLLSPRANATDIGAVEYQGPVVYPDTTPPAVPAGISASVLSSSQVNLAWTASTDPAVTGQSTSGVAGYDIYRNGTKVAAVTTTSYSNSGLSPATTYSYTVDAYDNAGNKSAQSNAVIVTTLTPTPTPTPALPVYPHRPTASNTVSQSGWQVIITDGSSTTPPTNGCVATVTWGDGASTTQACGTVFTKTYMKAGTYAVMETVADSASTLSSSAVPVEVSVPVKYSITITVTDNANNPISMAAVYLYGANGEQYAGLSGTAGAVTINGVNADTYGVNVVKSGYSFNNPTTVDTTGGSQSVTIKAN